MEENEKYKILIVDDSEMNRTILSDILDEKFTILEAEDGVEAISLIKKYKEEISLILLDLVMPNMDGLEVLALMNRYDWIDDIPVIMISSENSPAYIERAYELGVTDFINRPFNVFVVRKRVANTIMLYAKQKNLVSLVNLQIYEKVKTSDMMLNILSHIVEFRNGESGLHILHVNTITEILLKRLIQKTDKYMFSNEEIETIVIASSLHDIGKISIPDEVLNKPGRLTKEEFEIIKGHSKAGADMLDALEDYKNELLVVFAKQICLYHHERYDGRGYPYGIKGDDIPIAAQIVSIADVYDALTSERCYKKAISHREAINMIVNGECGAFNPLLLECLKDVEDILERNLSVKSLKRKNILEIKAKTDELLRQNQFSIANSSIHHLEQERIKNEFYASLSQEIQYECSFNPLVITLSDWCSNRYGLPQVITNPAENEKLVDILGGAETFMLFRREMEKTSTEKPVTQFVVSMKVENEVRHYRVYCRVEWSDDIAPEIVSSIGKIIDIEDEYNKIQTLTKSASIDPLTGIYNRGYGESLMNERLDNNDDANYAMLIFDVDNFKMANDGFGHMFGDEVLKTIAGILDTHSNNNNNNNNNVVARIGGDEFLMLVEYESEAKLQKLIDDIGEDVDRLDLGQFDVHLSVGIATTDKLGYNYNFLLSCADSALYHSKRTGKAKYAFYDKSMKLGDVRMTPIEN